MDTTKAPDHRLILAVSSVLIVTVSLLVWAGLRFAPSTLTPAQQARAAQVEAATKHARARMAAEDRQRDALDKARRAQEQQDIAACQEAAPRLFRHPGTVRTTGDPGIVTTTGPTKADILVPMTAQNSFGLRLTYLVLCLKDRQQITPIIATEK